MPPKPIKKNSIKTRVAVRIYIRFYKRGFKPRVSQRSVARFFGIPTQSFNLYVQTYFRDNSNY